jgi:ribosome-binding protein aMBF1 (putative translation factor)
MPVTQLQAGRVLLGLSREALAERANLCRHSIRKWEVSSDAVPARCTRTSLARYVKVEDARFSGEVSTWSAIRP